SLTRRKLYQLSYPGDTPILPGSTSTRPSGGNAPRLQVSEHLALDALQGVVDRLGIAVQQITDLLVAAALEIAGQHLRLETRERAPQALEQALKLLGGDHAAGGIVHGRAGQGVAERAVGLRLLAGRRVAERDVAVQRRVLVAGRRLDGGDDLARDAELGEAAERRLLRAVVPHGLVEADQPLLDEVFGVAPGEEVRARLQADEAGVAPHQLVERALVA